MKGNESQAVNGYGRHTQETHHQGAGSLITGQSVTDLSSFHWPVSCECVASNSREFIRLLAANRRCQCQQRLGDESVSMMGEKTVKLTHTCQQPPCHQSLFSVVGVTAVSLWSYGRDLECYLSVDFVTARCLLSTQGELVRGRRLWTNSPSVETRSPVGV